MCREFMSQATQAYLFSKDVEQFTQRLDFLKQMVMCNA